MAVDTNDTVPVLRRAEPPVMEFDPAGNLLKLRGQVSSSGHSGSALIGTAIFGLPTREPPRAAIIQVRSLRQADDDAGTKGVAGNTSSTFNGPGDVAVAANGDILVADGHVNARIVRFSKDERVIKTWGSKRTEPRQVNVPHSPAIDARG